MDAPVSGGTNGAEAGTLTIMISGEETAYREVRPALEVIGKNFFYLGSEPGRAQMMKLINNTLMAVATISAFEGLVLGAKAGLDPQTMLDVIKVSSGQSFATSNKIQQCVIDRSFPPPILRRAARQGCASLPRRGREAWVTMPVSHKPVSSSLSASLKGSATRILATSSRFLRDGPAPSSVLKDKKETA